MKIWVVKTSEMLASDNNSGRLLRSGLLAQMLDARDHEVTWWMSTFDHANRRSRSGHDAVRPFGTRGTIRMIHSPGYRQSVSFARLRDHAIWGRAFAREIERVPVPDIILCAYPTIEAAAVCVRYARRRGVPVVIDLRDMWPDIFAEFVPAALKPVVHWLLWPWRSRARSALRDATALFAITEEFLSWGLGLAGRARREWDGAFLLAYPGGAAVPAGGAPAARAAEFWDELGVKFEEGFNVVVVGSMTRRRFEMDTVIEAANVLQNDVGPVRFILVGDGDDLPSYRRLARDSCHVIFPGWLSAVQIGELLRRAHLGLVPYRNTPDLVMSVPNKVGEYLAAGVPVATCLRGTLARLLYAGRCGLSFEPNDPTSLATLVRRLRVDDSLRRELSDNARQVYSTELAADSVYGRLIERLQIIAAGAHEPRTVQTNSTRISA